MQQKSHQLPFFKQIMAPPSSSLFSEGASLRSNWEPVFSNFDQRQKLGERMTLRFPHGFEGRFTPKKTGETSCTSSSDDRHTVVRSAALAECASGFWGSNIFKGRIPLKKEQVAKGVENSPSWVVLKRHPSRWKTFPKIFELPRVPVPGYQFSPARMRSYAERVFASWFRAEFQKKKRKPNFENIYIYI